MRVTDSLDISVLSFSMNVRDGSRSVNGDSSMNTCTLEFRNLRMLVEDIFG